ncbi:MAG: tandem-95 repeat protein [Desulfobacteraceae bacterium]|nr:tandem-95 repeat protein [Desulfobacteraceae bacterium]
MGTKEWVELLVTTDTDMRGWLLRDIQGTGPGGVYVKFKPAPDTFWQSVPAGTLIVIYNANEKESFFPADDLSLSDGNFTIVTPHNNSILFDTTGDNQWLLFGNSNLADNPILLKNDLVTVVHDWDQGDSGIFTVNPPRPSANQAVHYTGNNDTGITDAANHTQTPANTVTPANPNGGANTAFINFLRNPITSKTPSADALNIDKTTDITIIFSDSIDGTSVTGISFKIDGSVSGSHTAVFTGGGTNTITANPDADFAAGETVTITLTTGIKTMAGVALGKPATWQFRIIETTAPVISSVTITTIDSVTALTALAKGTATGDGITERGFFWWTDWFASGTVPASGTGAGNFSLTLTNLMPQTTYKVSAYIRIGTQLITSGNFLTFTTTESHIPTVHTDTGNYTISNTDLTLNGEITDIGSSPVTIYGFVYAAHPYPTVWDMALPFTWDMTLPISSGKPFSGTIRNLSPGKYYVRAYAHNSIGTAYGEEFGFIIRGQNTLPTADAQTVNMIENAEITITLSGQDADNDPLIYMISKLPAKGKLYQVSSDDVSRISAITITTVPITVSDPNHKVLYSPTDDIGSGSDNFGFKVNDGLGDSAEALITINIAAMNHVPIIKAQSFSLSENAPKDTIVGTVGASDPDGDTLTYAIISGNQSGAFAINSVSGQITVADASGLNAGTVILTVRVNDARLWAEAAMTINIAAINHPPMITAQTFNIAKNVPKGTVVGTVAASDPDGDILTYSIILGNESGTFAIHPTSGQITVAGDSKLSAGTVILTVRVSDGVLSSDAIITVMLTNTSPAASDDTYRTDQGLMLSVPAPGVLANDNDADGDALTATALANPHHGSLKLNANGSFTYMPNENFSGTDIFTYSAGDTHEGSDAATVRIIVNPIIVIPDPPVFPEVPAFPPTVTILNHAPVLYPDIARLTLKTIDENIADKDNPGILISNLIDIFPDPITDEDAGAVEGIAVIAAENTNGIWQYDNNGQFTDFPQNIRESNSLLLNEDMLIRFVPNPGFAGTAKLVFRAWDQTSGRNTERADTTNNGGSTAFSMDTGEIEVRITAAPKDVPIKEDTEIRETPANDTDAIIAPYVSDSPLPEPEQPSVTTPTPPPEIMSETSVPEPPVLTESSAAVSENSDSGSGCFINSVSSDSLF